MDVKNDTAFEPDDWDELFGVNYFAEEETEETTDADTEESANEESEGTAEQQVNHEEESPEESEETAEETSEDEPKEEAREESEESEESDAESEEVGTEDSKPADEAKAILAQLKEVDSSIESFNDLEDVGLFASLLDNGKSPREALLESSPKLRSSITAAQKAASKSHLRSTAASAREDAIDMDAINTFRAMYPNKTEKEVIALYKRVRAR